MKKLTFLFVLALATSAFAQQRTPSEIARWQRAAQRITIIRDDWGIAHVYGTTDADAVFGMIYAQAEDDFNRVETNYLNATGRLAEAEGESAIWSDLRQRLYINPDSMKKYYRESPAWLVKLMNAWADGLNYYLYKHPDVRPRAITRFEPWMALTFTEGSIGGDIERVNLGQLEAFYGDHPEQKVTSRPGDEFPPDPTGSNGMVVAPRNTKAGHALLLINPHTSFFFRSELQMVSNEGLNAYGAVTWGQIFVYQGFNAKSGWMHTSSGVDNIDEYLETISKRGDRFYYKYGNSEIPVTVEKIAIPYKSANGMSTRVFTTYRTKHGPVVREQDGKWVTTSLLVSPVKQLSQSYLRTKTHNIQEFEKIMQLHTNSSNNTLYADAAGDIAYFHSNFIPQRDPHFDWTRPVDGSNPATDWGPPLPIDQTPNAINPNIGWAYNSNDAPWWAAGPDSPKQEDYPEYVQTGGTTPRGRHAVMVLQNKHDFTIPTLRDAAFDSYLPYFADELPGLIKAFDALPEGDALKAKLAEPVAALRTWDNRWGVNSIPTSLAVFWGTEVYRTRAQSPADRLTALSAAIDRLTSDFGTWKTPWGEINRFQRVNGALVQPFNDTLPSIPVPFTYGLWGSLASFSARPYPGTKKWYGTSGNSFVSVVEFGDSVRAIAVTAGGESGHPESKHFNDEAERYATGNLRPVYYYRSQLKGHTERTYHPGR